MSVGEEVMTVEHSVWIGMLDVDGDCPVVGVNGPLRPDHQMARLLIRTHLAPIGYVLVPAAPAESLSQRARLAAEASLAAELSRHLSCGDDLSREDGPAGPVNGLACPLRQVVSSGVGVSVVVCSRERPGDLETCLSAMRRISYEPMEILVVDNAPTSDTTRKLVEAMACDDPRIRYATEPARGLSAARNHGLEQAHYDIVAFTDDDTVADPNWPGALSAVFASEPGVVCVTGLVASTSLTTRSERYFEARYASPEPFQPCRYDENSRPGTLYPYTAGVFGRGANFALRRSGMTAIGGFDPRLGAGSTGLGGEDLDMFLRVILAGGSIQYEPSALIWHRHRPDEIALSEQLYAYGHGLGAYVAKHLHDRRLFAALISHGARHGWSLVRQMRHASAASQLGSRGSLLAADELRGMVAGAARYWVSRWRRRSYPSCQP
jgi:glycosyltransferase involved in cell wall biosynthesis